MGGGCLIHDRFSRMFTRIEAKTAKRFGSGLRSRSGGPNRALKPARRHTDSSQPRFPRSRNREAARGNCHLLADG